MPLEIAACAWEGQAAQNGATMAAVAAAWARASLRDIGFDCRRANAKKFEVEKIKTEQARRKRFVEAACMLCIYVRVGQLFLVMVR